MAPGTLGLFRLLTRACGLIDFGKLRRGKDQPRGKSESCFSMSLGQRDSDSKCSLSRNNSQFSNINGFRDSLCISSFFFALARNVRIVHTGDQRILRDQILFLGVSLHRAASGIVLFRSLASLFLGRLN